MTDEDRQIQIEFIHNVYKDLYGCRPRQYDFASMTDAEIDALADSLLNESNEEDYR